jgi:hypothetical protein
LNKLKPTQSGKTFHVEASWWALQWHEFRSEFHAGMAIEMR